MKQYLQVEGCSRQWLMSHFGCKVDHSNFTFIHECCDNCMQNCKCNAFTCGEFCSSRLEDECDMPELVSGNSTFSHNYVTRVVTSKDKQKPIQFHHDMLNEIKLEAKVTCPNILLEFNMFHINQVLDSCHCLFTIHT